jgi:hypothetical protein
MTHLVIDQRYTFVLAGTRIRGILRSQGPGNILTVLGAVSGTGGTIRLLHINADALQYVIEEEL